jgi:M-phase inducer tyrosine phosphatase
MANSLCFTGLFINGRIEECITTPPLPSSSPAATMEMMDMSPLPHKVPFALTTEVALDSPTPETSSADSTMTSMTSPLDESPIELEQPPVLEE